MVRRDEPGTGRMDEDRFLAVFEQHVVAIHAYLSRRAGRGTADELLSEVWVRAVSSRKGYVGVWSQCLPWLYGIARNTLRTHWAQEARYRRFGAHEARGHDPYGAVDDRLDAQAAGPALRAALSSLSEGEREVLLLVAWELLTPTEAAAVLGIPAATARVRLHRARSRMAHGIGTPAIDRGVPLNSQVDRGSGGATRNLCNRGGSSS